ncbi:MAG: 16S rRNA (cytosine(1402)-N(4))-methyltransferase RsmH [Chlamydiota bacterium]
MNFDHIPVMAQEVSDCFQSCSLRVFVDGTLGLGGHAKLILEQHPEIEQFIGIDEDREALDIARQNLQAFNSKTHCLQGNFRDIAKLLKKTGIAQIDGLLLDLGVSSLQLDKASRGLSFSKEGPLDMRRDPSGAITAEEIVNTYSEKELGRIIRDYGEERRWRAAAHAIVEGRRRQPLKTTLDLAEVLAPVLRYNPKKKIHPLTLTFQALRIAVNDELGAIEEIIPTALQILRPHGRIAIISFHSLEDRIVKHTFKLAASKQSTSPDVPGLELEPYPTAKILTKKPLIPSTDEMKANPRSRSAKLRCLEKLPPEG